MTRFSFRLQRVLDYRETVLEEAERAYLAARAERLAAEQVFQEIEERRQEVASMPAGSLGDRQAMVALWDFCDRRQREQESVVEVLAQDEARRRGEWLEARKEVEVLRKLRERQETEWRIELGRAEQAELDEWAVLRRAA